jgi:hypothetical protein
LKLNNNPIFSFEACLRQKRPNSDQQRSGDGHGKIFDAKSINQKEPAAEQNSRCLFYLIQINSGARGGMTVGCLFLICIEKPQTESIKSSGLGLLGQHGH